MNLTQAEAALEIFVSIIIPVYNEPAGLQKCLSQAVSQDYPQRLYEIIVVDNGSTDNTVSVAQAYEGVTLCSETAWKGSPYSARNRGIETAQGAVFAFVDANCYPSESWLREGIATLSEQQADLVGGDVQFYFSEPVTSAQLLDALTNIRMKESVLERGVAKTANLFVRRTVFDTIGLFPEGARSGEDVRWTGKAVQYGYKLAFSERALVWKAARPFRALVKKQWRVAKAQPAIWQSQGRKVSLWHVALQAIIPPSRRTLSKTVQERGEPFISHYARIWLLQYFIKALMRFGNCYAMIQRKLS